MHRATIIVVKSLLAVMLGLLLFVQIAMVPPVAAGYARTYPELAHLEFAGMLIAILFLVCVQVVLLCVWRLMSLVGRSTIFSERAFLNVDIITGAILAATLLIVVGWVALFLAEVSSPSVTILCLLGFLVGLGLALVVVVMRGLLQKALQLEQDLSEVV